MIYPINLKPIKLITFRLVGCARQMETKRNELEASKFEGSTCVGVGGLGRGN